jgi:hypothetical protein
VEVSAALAGARPATSLQDMIAPQAWVIDDEGFANAARPSPVALTVPAFRVRRP